jgi:hypothetical protein
MTRETTAKTHAAEWPEESKGRKERPHTELRPAGTKPAPRATVMPSELRDEGEDDLFNDMPV